MKMKLMYISNINEIKMAHPAVPKTITTVSRHMDKLFESE